MVSKFSIQPTPSPSAPQRTHAIGGWARRRELSVPKLLSPRASRSRRIGIGTRDEGGFGLKVQ